MNLWKECWNRVFLIMAVIVSFAGTGFAVNSGEIEAVMREYQSKYHYVAKTQGKSSKFLSFPARSCDSGAPSYPSGYYGDISEEKAESLVNSLVEMFYSTHGGSNISGYFLHELPGGEQDPNYINDLAAPDNDLTWQEKLGIISGDIDKLVHMGLGGASTVDYIGKAGSGWGKPV